MKKKKKGLIILICFGIVLVIGILSFFTFGIIQNNKKENFKGSVTEPNSDFKLKLVISNGWTNDIGTENQVEAQQLDFTIIDDKVFNLNKWSMTISIDVEGYELLEVSDFWNITFEADGNTITVVPNSDIDLVSISKTKNNSFGVILFSNIKLEDSDFGNITYSLSGTRNRAFNDYPMFWVLLLSVIIYIAVTISYIVIKAKERNFEAFKENTYKIINQAMNTFAGLIDVKDPYTKDHSARVSYYSVKIARKLGLDDDTIRNIAYIALMHDCGKLLIDDDILTKPAKLTAEEYQIMKTHTTNGGKALKNFTSIEGIVDGAMYHHEHYDGTGYPKGLAKEEIPLIARIIAVADALDAMASDRCYRKRLTVEVIKQELIECSGTQFDPKIAKLVVEMIDSGEINVNENA